MKRAVFVLALALAACMSSGRPLGKPATLYVGDMVRYAGGPTVAFRRIVTDSRCPPNVTCIQKGDITVEVLVRTGDQWQPLTLNFDRTPKGTVGDRTIELKDATPPRSTPPAITIVAM